MALTAVFSPMSSAARLIDENAVAQPFLSQAQVRSRKGSHARNPMSLLHLFVNRGTIKGVGRSEFNAEKSAEQLRNAFKGLGTDEKTIISVLATHTNSQRQLIKKRYKTMFGKDLISDFEDELGGHFLDLVLAMMCPAHFYDAHCMRKAIVGMGTNESTLIEILCTRSNSELELLREAYFAEFRRNLEGDILSETSGDFSHLLVSMLNADRDERDEIDWNLAAQDANKLKAIYDSQLAREIKYSLSRVRYVVVLAGIRAGINKLGTDEAVFNHIMCLRSMPQLRATVEEYKRLTKRDLENDIRKEFGGDLRDGLLAIVKIAKSPPGFFAEILHDAISGAGTDDETVIRVVVSRSEIDLEDIKEEYQTRYKKTLAKAVKEDTSGDYSRLLLKIIHPRNI